MKKTVLYALCFSSISFAQDFKTDFLTSEKVKEGFSFNGYVDVNYFHNLNNPQNGSKKL
jgi:hypothetical protein